MLILRGLIALMKDLGKCFLVDIINRVSLKDPENRR